MSSYLNDRNYSQTFFFNIYFIVLVRTLFYLKATAVVQMLQSGQNFFSQLQFPDISALLLQAVSDQQRQVEIHS